MAIDMSKSLDWNSLISQKFCGCGTGLFKRMLESTTPGVEGKVSEGACVDVPLSIWLLFRGGTGLEGVDSASDPEEEGPEASSSSLFCGSSRPGRQGKHLSRSSFIAEPLEGFALLPLVVFLPSCPFELDFWVAAEVFAFSVVKSPLAPVLVSLTTH